MKKATFQHIEAELQHYHDSLKEIQQRRMEITHPMKDEVVGGGASLPSSSTERIAVKLVNDRKLNELQRIVEAIEKVHREVPDDYKKLIKLKYWTKPQTMTWEGIAQLLNVSRRTAFRYRNQIIQAIADVLGWH